MTGIGLEWWDSDASAPGPDQGVRDVAGRTGAGDGAGGVADGVADSDVAGAVGAAGAPGAARGGPRSITSTFGSAHGPVMR